MTTPDNREGAAFAAALDDMLGRYRRRQSDVARSLGTSDAYVSALKTGRKVATAQTADRIADALEASAEDRVRLHRAAAQDAGFRLELPEDF